MVCAMPKILVGAGALHLSFPSPVKMDKCFLFSPGKTFAAFDRSSNSHAFVFVSSCEMIFDSSSNITILFLKVPQFDLCPMCLECPPWNAGGFEMIHVKFS
jgi:hypothetical protein